jgi:endo-1,4-beta-xylanase
MKFYLPGTNRRGWLLLLTVSCIGLAGCGHDLTQPQPREQKSALGDMTPFDGTVWSNDNSPYPSGFSHRTYHSDSMNVDVGYLIYLPPEYGSNTQQSFPVIYHLHGYGGDENGYYQAMLDDLGSQVIHVFPNGGRNSKYMDASAGSPMDGVEMVETTIIRELIPHVDATYRTMHDKSGRAMQGASMGGHGALRLAFKYPELFSSVFSMCAAIDDNASNVLEGEPELMLNMFNNDPDLFDAQTSQSIIRNNAGNVIGEGLAIYMAIGSEDGLLPDNQAMDDLLTSLNIPHRPLVVVPGYGHCPPLTSIDPTPTQWAISHFGVSNGCTPNCSNGACGSPDGCGGTCGNACNPGCTDHCSNGAADCDEDKVDCGGASCGACSGGTTSLGCFADGADRDLAYGASDDGATTTESCIATCQAAGYAYAGTQDGSQCFCANSYGAYGQSDACDMACSGDATETCGGPWANSVYATGVGGQLKVTPRHAHRAP